MLGESLAVQARGEVDQLLPQRVAGGARLSQLCRSMYRFVMVRCAPRDPATSDDDQEVFPNRYFGTRHGVLSSGEMPGR